MSEGVLERAASDRPGVRERVPDFLVIGAMKCGTTTLYRDLDAQRSLFFPIDKEPHTLVDDGVLSSEGRSAYARMFERAGQDQLCGEASTGYTKRPVNEGVAERTLRVCGPELRAIYLVRDPLQRILSHHYHRMRDDPSVSSEAELESFPDYVNFSRYAWQVEPWIETFGADRVRVVIFEEFVRDRVGTSRELCEFLGVPFEADRVDPEARHNVGDTVANVDGGLVGAMRQTVVWKWVLRPLMPFGVRDRLRRMLGKPPPERPRPPSVERLGRLADAVRADAERLGVLLGRSGPIWDLDATARKLSEADGAG